MKKLLALAITMMMAFTLVACSNNNKAQLNTENKNILVAYFSLSGNTKMVADQIHENVGGDIFEINTEDAYPTDYDAVVDQAKKEQEENYRPKLATKVENIDSYDVIFIGYPNWWGTMPMAVFTFLEEYKLSGKTIIPFCTHDGSAFGKSIEDIKKIAPESKILDGLEIQGKSVTDENKEVSEWLRKLGIIK
jgi:flavodoxin